MKKILIVEDDITIRNNITEILLTSGYEPFSANNGVDAMLKVSNNLPDLIISDIMMPEMDGYKFFEKFNELFSNFNVPFIFLSAKIDQIDIRKGMNIGVDDYITKPFKIKDLIDTIEARLAKSEKQKEFFDKFTSDIIHQYIPHELRTPLVAILGISEIIRDDYNRLSGSDIIDFADKINQAGNRLHKRIEKFLSLIELDQIQTKNISESFSNSTEIKRIEDIILDFNLKSKRIIILPLLPDQRIKINFHFLSLLLKEILENADKFSPKNTEINISYTVSLNQLKLNIINFSEGNIIKINENQIIDFFQTDKEIKQQPGNGLGLAIVKRISKIYNLDFSIGKNENNEVIASIIFSLIQ